jgi:hypothetical protein
MTRVWIAFLLLPLLAQAADESRVSLLEQDVRELKRQVVALSRQVDELRSRPARPEARATTGPGRGPASDPERWVDAAKWSALRPGMSELEVVTLLGPPTSMRDEDGARVLLYALEIGSSGYFGGGVVMRDRKVAEVRRPTLQ